MSTFKVGDIVRLSPKWVAHYIPRYYPGHTIFYVSKITATGRYCLMREDGQASITDRWTWPSNALESVSPLELLAREAACS